MPPVLSFQHRLLQEYMAAVYIVHNIMSGTAETFLLDAFPSYEKIEAHWEVIQFACGTLGKNDVFPLLNFVSKSTAACMQKEIDDGSHFFTFPYILASCHKESGIPTISQNLSLYPSCRLNLAEVLKITDLVFIDDIDMNEPLELSPCPSQIVVRLAEIDGKKYDRLWRALHKIPTNLIALHLFWVMSENVSKLHHFSQLKYLSIVNFEELSESIGEGQQKLRSPVCKTLSHFEALFSQLLYQILLFIDVTLR